MLFLNLIRYKHNLIVVYFLLIYVCYYSVFSSFLISFLLLLWFLPCCGFEIGPEAVLGYIKCFLPDDNFNLMILSPHKGSWDCIPLFIMAGLWFVGFLRIRKDKVFPFVFMIVVLTIASFFGIGTYEYSGVASYAWIMLAGIGCVSFEAFSKKERVAEFVQKEEREKEIRKLERERMLEIENERKNAGKVKEEKKTRRTVPECVELTPVKIILSEDFPDEEKSSESDEIKQLGIGRRNVPQTYHSNVAVADMNAVGKKETVEPASEAGTVTESMEETIPEMEKVTEAIEESIPESQKEIEVVKESVTESEKETGVLEESVSESNIYNAAQTVSVDGINVAKVILSSESETSDVKEQNNVSQPAVSRRYLKMPSSGASLSEEPGNTRVDIAKVEVPKNVDVAERPKVVVVSQNTPKPIHQEESLSDIKVVSERKPKMIRNPLAGPKPHVPRELNYDYEPVDAEMKFDIDDISGRDYYDL